MCLRVKGLGLFPKRRKRDVKCYKVLEQITYSNGLVEFLTPCARAVVKHEIIDGADNYVAKKTFFDEMSPVKEGILNTCYIASGFIHVFKHLRSAERFVNACDSHYNLKIYECIIPAGTTFYKGFDETTENKAYAADKIKFVKRVS